MSDDAGLLSERELEVLRLVATGATNQEIARSLVISPNTVKVHLRNIFDKMGVQSRTEATMVAVRQGWVPVSGAVAIPSEGQAPAAPAELLLGGAGAASARPPIERWQRVYLLAAAVIVVLAAMAPPLRAARYAPRTTVFTDVGQPQIVPATRPQVARWTGNASLPEPRSRLALVAVEDPLQRVNSRLYAIGGETATTVTGQVTIYDIEKNTWSSGSTKPTAVANVAGALLGDRIYVPGGTTADGSVTNVLEVYDVGADRWEARAILPVPLSAYALAAVDGKLYLFGGWDGRSYRAEAYVYDPAQDGWTVITPMPKPRGFAAATALGGVIYVVGGFDGERELATVDVYDPAGEGSPAGPWSGKAPLSQPRGGLGLAAVGTQLYAIGGGWTVPLAFNEQYDVQTGAWSRIETPVVGEWRNLGVAAFGQQVYAVGGWNGTYLAVNETYQALLRQLLPFGSKGN
jgi:DNA-binding CsgD family transcriptional regulator